MIHRLSAENPPWGAPRIHGEMLKLGHDVAEATVGKYMALRPGPRSQSWRTFVNNHRSEIVVIDFLTVPTATFRVLYVFVVLSLDRRRIAHFNVTDSPSTEWTSLQLIPTFPFDTARRYVIRDRDSIYGEKVVETIRALGIEGLRRAGDRNDPAGVPRPRDRVRRAASAAGAAGVRRLLPRIANAPRAGQGRAGAAGDPASRRRRRIHSSSSRRTLGVSVRPKYPFQPSR